MWRTGSGEERVHRRRPSPQVSATGSSLSVLSSRCVLFHSGKSQDVEEAIVMDISRDITYVYTIPIIPLPWHLCSRV